jgi:hypothetical protein
MRNTDGAMFAVVSDWLVLEDATFLGGEPIVYYSEYYVKFGVLIQGYFYHMISSVIG